MIEKVFFTSFVHNFVPNTNNGRKQCLRISLVCTYKANSVNEEEEGANNFYVAKAAIVIYSVQIYSITDSLKQVSSIRITVN